MSKHVCKYWRTYGPTGNSPRAFRICTLCNKRQYKDREFGWRDEIKLERFINDWLPTRQHASDYNSLMTVEVAFPFEFRCYESWNMAIKVKFHLNSYGPRTATRIDCIDGWESPWCEDLNEVDALLRKFYQEQTGKTYEIGDNAYEEMRRIIQS